MALVKKDDQLYVSTWSKRDKKAVRHKLPDNVEKAVIDYTKLKELCDIDGLRDRKNDKSSAEAHEEFMANYRSIFVRPEVKKGFPIHSLHRSEERGSTSTLQSKLPGGKTLSDIRPTATAANPAETASHDIRDYLPKLHRGRRPNQHEAVRGDSLKRVRKILRKLPFERTAADNDQLFAVLRTVSQLADHVTPEVVKELCVVAVLDDWRQEGVTLFGRTGWHLILRGAVRPQTGHVHAQPGGTPDPQQSPQQSSQQNSQQSPQQPPLCTLRPGDCFGTLEPVSDHQDNSTALNFKTADPNCEFLKISCKNYARVMEKMGERERAEKVGVLQACRTFSGWSSQALSAVADMIQWAKFPANTVLVSEGFRAPFIGFIKSGTCHVLRQVEVKNTLPNGTQEGKTKQVVMGKLGASDSFGEMSVLQNEPITCSIITASSVHLANIEPHKLQELDKTTRQLLIHSSEPTYGKLTQADIHEEYIQQEQTRQWNEFKHNVVVDVINSRGIRPGYGKWAK